MYAARECSSNSMDTHASATSTYGRVGTGPDSSLGSQMTQANPIGLSDNPKYLAIIDSELVSSCESHDVLRIVPFLNPPQSRNIITIDVL